MRNQSFAGKLFDVCNHTLLIALGLLSLLPIIHIMAVSFSSATAASTGAVGLWPVGFTLTTYKFILGNEQFISSFGVSLRRAALGVSVNMLLTVLVAYPLSKEKAAFPLRSVYAWVFMFSILFSGGLIPLYITVSMTGLIDSVWSLVLPTGLPIFNVIVLLNFFRQLPKELEEAAFMDGASHWAVLWKIYLPLSLPSLATLTLFCIVFHWNSWFDGLIYMNSPSNYPLQSYLQTLIVVKDVNSFVTSPEQWKEITSVTERTMKSAQIFLAALPVMLVYPFLQKYFAKGLVLGSVKG